MAPLWGSFAAGLAGLIYVFLSGIVRALRRRLAPTDSLFIPWLAVAALFLPIPFFFTQSFLRLGDLTLASGLLAVVTGALPLAMLFGLWSSFRHDQINRGAPGDKLAMLGVLQWGVVLFFWGLVPLRLWE